jgi:hypothetical protein
LWLGRGEVVQALEIYPPLLALASRLVADPLTSHQIQFVMKIIYDCMARAEAAIPAAEAETCRLSLLSLADSLRTRSHHTRYSSS